MKLCHLYQKVVLLPTSGKVIPVRGIENKWTSDLKNRLPSETILHSLKCRFWSKSLRYDHLKILKTDFFFTPKIFLIKLALSQFFFNKLTVYKCQFLTDLLQNRYFKLCRIVSDGSLFFRSEVHLFSMSLTGITLPLVDKTTTFW